jgi:subtilase family serine protease
VRASRPALGVALAAIALTLLAAAPGAGARVRVGAAPTLPAGASRLGAAPAEQRLQLYVALEPRDPAALGRFAGEVSTPGSPLYGQYLSVPEFARRFGATPAEVATVRSALASRGLGVGPAGANDLSLPVTATVAEAEAAFGVSIDRVRTASGRIAHANDRAPALAATAAPFVQGVIGLDDVAESHRNDGGQASSSSRQAAAVPASTAISTGGPQPCQAALDQQGSEGGYTADQIAAAYGLDGLYAAGDLGAGQTVALLEMEPYGQADIDAYQECFGTEVEVSAVDVEGGPGPYKGEDGEAALDIEQVTGLAPGTRIVVYQGPNPSEPEILSAWVQDDVAKVMSSSWGLCEKETEVAEMTAVDTLLQEAAAQGQSFFVAAGDYGSTDCAYEHHRDESLNVDFPAGDPWATAVGGTRLESPTATPPAEYLWNDSPEWGAGGGGISERFPMPAYQQAAAPGLGVIGPLSSGAPCGNAGGYCRQVPDVSADAALESGWVIHAEGSWEVNGGTSAAAPFWAAFTALTNADPACAGRPIGFANPALYALAGTGYAADFRDVTTYRPGGMPTTDPFDSSEPFPATPGYDMASGLGTPLAAGLAASLCPGTPEPEPGPEPEPNPGPEPGTPAPAPAPTSPSVHGGGTSSPSPSSPVAPPVPAISHAALVGIATGRPRLVLRVTARPGAKLKTVVVELPPGLTAGRRAHTVRLGLPKPRRSARLTLAFPALRATRKLRRRVNSGRARSLRLVVVLRETGGRSARLPLVLPLGRR